MIRIVADENIPFAREAFGTLGEVTLVHGRSLCADQLRQADLLFVRSITKVNASLLEGTPVHFVATATAGTDHCDLDYLQSRGVAFSDAPGSNAISVGEYMVAAWLKVAGRKGIRLRGKKIGIIGVGNVGAQVARRAEALGMKVVRNDPPKADATGDPKYQPLEAVYDCDIVTCHTPLTSNCKYPTKHLANEDFFSRLKDGVIFCNAGRGGVVDTAALKASISKGKISACVLDVWENEPRIDPEILGLVDIASPHIAGYSYDGKIRGTEMVYQAACRFLGVKPSWSMAQVMPPTDCPLIEIDTTGRTDEDILRAIVSRLYPIEKDDAALRATIPMSPEERGVEFDRQRKQYPVRREFSNTKVVFQNASEQLKTTTAGLDFMVG